MWKLFAKKCAGNNSWKGGKDAQIIIFIYLFIYLEGVDELHLY